MHELFGALCLVLVVEGIFLFAAPHAWKRFADEMRQLEPKWLRVVGGFLMGAGVAFLQLMH